ncbi:unnamed protein product [Mucor hiemalis]
MTNYISSLQNQTEISQVEKSFMQVAQSYIINIMGKKLCESYINCDSFTSTDLNIMRSIHKLHHFNTDTNAEVKNLADPLRKSFLKGGLHQVRTDIQLMKNTQESTEYSLRAEDYQLLDIIDYMAGLCQLSSEGGNNDAFMHWQSIFNLLFRGTNIKLTGVKSKLSLQSDEEIRKDINSKSDSSKHESGNTIIFQSYEQPGTTATANFNGNKPSTTLFELENVFNLSYCLYTAVEDQKDALHNEMKLKCKDDKETIDQNESILLNKSILDSVLKPEYSDKEEEQSIYIIGIHLVGYIGYIYAIRRYKGVYIAFQVCVNTIFMPQSLGEFQYLLFHDCMLEILCNLKKYFIGTAKMLKTERLAE